MENKNFQDEMNNNNNEIGENAQVDNLAQGIELPSSQGF